jgi:hypothetical protein
MEFIVWVETRLAGKRLEIREVAKVERRATGIGPEELGLTLADGKTVPEDASAQELLTRRVRILRLPEQIPPCSTSAPS